MDVLAEFRRVRRQAHDPILCKHRANAHRRADFWPGRAREEIQLGLTGGMKMKKLILYIMSALLLATLAHAQQPVIQQPGRRITIENRVILLVPVQQKKR